MEIVLICRLLEGLKDVVETMPVPRLTEAETEQLLKSIEKDFYREHR